MRAHNVEKYDNLIKAFILFEFNDIYIFLYYPKNSMQAKVKKTKVEKYDHLIIVLILTTKQNTIFLA